MKNKDIKLNFDFSEKSKNTFYAQNSNIDALKSILPCIPDVVEGLRKESASSLCGPCPKCGGTDRFVYKIDQQRFWCRQCCPQGGDTIDFHCWLDGIDVKTLMKKYLPGKNSKPVTKNTYRKTKPFEHYELGSPVKKYPYTDASGKVLYWNCRFEPKAFRQCSADGLKWSTKNIKPKVPYNLLKVIEAKTVFIFEGEKDCDKAEKLGLVGTCNVAGAGNWTPDLNKYFNDKEIFLIPDNDEPGRKHIEKVYQGLKEIVGSIKIIELPGLSEGGDFTDWLDSFNDLDEAGERFSILIENAKIYEPPKEITINEIILSFGEFCKIKMAKKETYLYPWLKECSINLLSGWRGAGKTWFALSVLDAVSRGVCFGPWQCKKSVPCLFCDGEMPPQDIVERINDLDLNPELFIYSDALSNQYGLPRANLADEKWRNKLKEILIARKIKLWVVDNIASLASGLDENCKRDWDPINQWLLELRFAGISTILLHHTNKDGGQRGTSGREDNIDVSLMLKRPHDYQAEDGARFIINFSKARVRTKDLNLIADTEFKLIQNETGQYVWTFGNIKQERKREVLKLLDEGINQKSICETLDISKGYVSKIRKQAIKEGLLTARCKLTPSGFEYVNAV